MQQYDLDTFVGIDGITIHEGNRVNVFWPAGQQQYTGTVTYIGTADDRAAGGVFEVDYDAGGVEPHPIAEANLFQVSILQQPDNGGADGLSGATTTTTGGARHKLQHQHKVHWTATTGRCQR